MTYNNCAYRAIDAQILSRPTFNSRLTSLEVAALAAKDAALCQLTDCFDPTCHAMHHDFFTNAAKHNFREPSFLAHLYLGP